ncbi:MAG: hypothetical protein ABJN42_03685 [Roseibium sp.]|uniref:hypothetical protein n=1 Tax=Alphaproteobacteria TaxID=28211 RepID=UPI003298A5AC
MTRFALISGLALAMAVPVSASAQDILRQRLDSYANRVEGLFTNDQYGHAIKSLEDERKLKISLLRNHQRSIEVLHLQLEQIENDLAKLNPDYVPMDHREIGVIANTTFDEGFAPEPVTTCTLNADGTIGTCDAMR